MDIQIRTLQENDYTELTKLLTELGYPSTTEDVTFRYNELQKQTDYEGLVAVKNKQVVGFAGVCKAYYFEMTGSYTRILAFVISSQERKQGIGKKLLSACEQWAKVQGCNAIALNSGNREERKAAHAFYNANGYLGKSTGFSKEII
ncbi:GNAT family N-acetyltransferase [Rummeliibacillus pycnus]|uniref:GNAT family N-acetyltransferase n=1 Tax=Rummeliibacillus pycnus TaxID=101070 RepID=UPI0037C93B55